MKKVQFNSNPDHNTETFDPMTLLLRLSEAEMQREEKQALFRQAFDYAPIGMAIVGLDSKFIEINHAFCRMLGYKAEQLMQLDLYAVTHPNDLEQIISLTQQILEGKIKHSYVEKRYIHQNQQPVWVMVSLSLVRNIQTNAPLYFLIQTLDIHQQKLREHELRVHKQRLLSALECSEQGLWDWNLITNEVYFDEQWKKILGYAPHDSIEEYYHMWIDHIYPEDRQQVMVTLKAHLEDHNDFFEAEYRAYQKDQQLIWLNVRGRVWETDQRGKPLRMLGTIADISSRKKLEEEVSFVTQSIKNNEVKMRAILDAAADGIITIDMHGIIQDVNRACENMFGYQEDELIGQPISVLIPEKARNVHIQLFEHYDHEVAQKMLGHNVELQGLHHDGTIFPLELNISELRLGDELFFTSIVRDITDRKKSESIIKHLAYYDALTDLPNRRLFYEQLEKSKMGPFSLMYVDLDQFKIINDNLGHLVGDKLLRSVATRMNACVSKEDFVARLGGDEFAIIVNSDQLNRTAPTAKKLLEKLSQPFFIDGRELHISASIGISLYPNDTYDLDILVKNADIALYSAKAFGRNNYQYYHEEMGSKLEERLMIETELRQALEQDQFFLVYQPKITLEDGSVAGVEALIRWHHPKLGFIAPIKFIPIAEETGLIVPIGEWVLRTACQQVKLWQSEGLPPVRVAVNLSSVQFNQENLCEMIDQILKETDLDPEWLEIELTESTVMQDAAKAVRILNEIKEMGITLSVDDFGTGYSSLSYLKRLPIQQIKVDRSFVMDLPHNHDDVILTQTIINLGKNLRLNVVAEGVETIEQLHMLREFGCHQVQGYFFSRPMEASQFIVFLNKYMAQTSAY